MKAESNKEKINQAAKKLIKRDGLINLSLTLLCREAGVNPNSFQHWMGVTFTEFLANTPKEWRATGKPKKSNKTRASARVRKEHILSTAVSLSETEGYNKITRDKLAENASVSSSLVTRYFNTMAQLRRAIMRRAIADENLKIIAQGLASSDAQARKAPEELRRRAASLLAG